MCNNKFLTAVILLIGYLPIPVVAQVTDADDVKTDTEITMTIKPHICIAPRGQSSCISRIDVFWQSNQLADVCLHVSLESAALQCWEQSKTGTYQHRVNIIKNLDYWMASMNQQHMWAQSSVKFAALKPHRKHKRRRNRLPWSIQSL